MLRYQSTIQSSTIAKIVEIGKAPPFPLFLLLTNRTVPVQQKEINNRIAVAISIGLVALDVMLVITAVLFDVVIDDDDDEEVCT